ncbi:hypothetical protein JEM66_25590 [Klebsiella oxytoca]|nr:hypothetical protein [Klebsiella oxytoca]
MKFLPATNLRSAKPCLSPLLPDKCCLHACWNNIMTDTPFSDETVIQNISIPVLLSLMPLTF